MRSIVVLEVRQHRTNARLWAWCLANEDPPGFQRTWFTLPGGMIDRPDATFADVDVERELFTYTTRDSKLSGPEAT